MPEQLNEATNAAAPAEETPDHAGVIALGKMRDAALLVASGQFTNAQIAQMVGIHANTISKWIKRHDFHATCIAFHKELDQGRLADALLARGPHALSILDELIRTSTDEAVKARCAMWLVEMGAGKAPQRIEHSVAKAAPADRLADLDRKLDAARARVAQAKSGRLGGAAIVEATSRDLVSEGSE